MKYIFLFFHLVLGSCLLAVPVMQSTHTGSEQKCEDTCPITQSDVVVQGHITEALEVKKSMCTRCADCIASYYSSIKQYCADIFSGQK